MNTSKFTHQKLIHTTKNSKIVSQKLTVPKLMFQNQGSQMSLTLKHPLNSALAAVAENQRNYSILL